MTTTILIVDDDPVVREILTTQFQILKPEWHIHIAESASKALEICSGRPVDIIFSDLDMPGMSGDELLRKIAAAYPLIIRLMLSSHTDAARELTAASVCHRFFSKPPALKEVVSCAERALALRSRISTPRLKKVLSQTRSLPAPPERYFAIRGLLARNDFHLDTLVDLVEEDPALATLILRLANSPFYGARYTVTSLRQATTLLGTETVSGVILSQELYGHTSPSLSREFGLGAVWTHSLQVAELSAHLAAADRCTRELRDECYTAGLVHDVGKMVLAQAVPDLYRQALRLTRTQGLAADEAEEQLLGISHAEAGGYLLTLWGIPENICEAATFHHHPILTPAPRVSPLYYVTLANEVLRQKEQNQECEGVREYLIRHGGQRILSDAGEQLKNGALQLSPGI